MADTVQELLEDMVPELEDLARKRIFSQPEIKEIVRRRRDFEYKLKRRESQKSEYLRYVQYERTLDKLRGKRKKRLGYGKKSKSSVSDFSMQKRLHFIFDRMLRKWKGDVALWMQYIDFCVDQGANKMLHSVFARALQYHPRDVSLWARAATWHFDEQGDIRAARVMCQRGLRMIQESVELWSHYLRLELCYIDKLRQRQKVLGIEGDVPSEGRAPPGEGEGQQDDAEPDDEEDEDSDDDEDDGEDEGGEQKGKDRKKAAEAPTGARALAQATARMASAIVGGAREALGDSLPLLLSLASVCADFPHTAVLEDEIFSEVAQKFPDSAKGWAAAAGRATLRVQRKRQAGLPVPLDDVVAAEEFAHEVFRGAAADRSHARQPALWEAYVGHIKARLARCAPTGTDGAEAEAALRSAYEQMVGEDALGGRCPQGLLCSYASDLALLGEGDAAHTVTEKGCAALAEAGEPVGKLAQLHLGLTIKAAAAGEAGGRDSAVHDALMQCVAQVGREASHSAGSQGGADGSETAKKAEAGAVVAELWQEYLTYMLACEAEDEAISAAIEEGVGACLRLSPAAGAALRVRQLHWVCATAGADAGRALYRRLIRDGDAAASGAAAAAFVRSCIALEASTCATEGRRPAETVEPIRWLFEVASRLEGQPSHLSPFAQALRLTCVRWAFQRRVTTRSSGWSGSGMKRPGGSGAPPAPISAQRPLPWGTCNGLVGCGQGRGGGALLSGDACAGIAGRVHLDARCGALRQLATTACCSQLTKEQSCLSWAHAGSPSPPSPLSPHSRQSRHR